MPVVVDPPVLGEYLGFEQSVKELLVEQLVPDPGVQRFDVCVLPGGSRLDEAGSRAGEPAPVSQGVRGQLGAVIHADEARGAAPGFEQLLEDLNGPVGRDRTRNFNGQDLPGELVDDVEYPEPAAVSGLIVLEIKRPDVIGSLGLQVFLLGRRMPSRLLFLALWVTLRPSSLQILWTFLRLTTNPFFLAIA